MSSKQPFIVKEKKPSDAPPELFPPDGKGIWAVNVEGRPAERIMERLKPLMPVYVAKKWQDTIQECKKRRA